MNEGCRAVAQMGEGGLVDASYGSARQQAFVFWYGAIAQLGERVLCKHEVVGSIPSGSTRWLSKIDEVASFIPSAKHHFARRVPNGMRVRDF